MNDTEPMSRLVEVLADRPYTVGRGDATVKRRLLSGSVCGN